MHRGIRYAVCDHTRDWAPRHLASLESYHGSCALYCGGYNRRGGSRNDYAGVLMSAPLRKVTATRYITPLREGGSLPGLVEADDDGMYVVKFRGAGQGSGALVAELVVGELARVCGLPVPELVFIDIDPVLVRSEPDDEVQALVQASAGLNLASDFLPGALPFDAALVDTVDTDLASAIVWFDALMTNIDRTPRNTNILIWHRKLHVIDHGAALYVMHAWDGFESRIQSPFSAIRDHVLLPAVGNIEDADALLHARLTPASIAAVLDLVPTAWWPLGRRWQHAVEAQAALQLYLEQRLHEPRAFVAEVARARTALI